MCKQINLSQTNKSIHLIHKNSMSGMKKILLSGLLLSCITFSFAQRDSSLNGLFKKATSIFNSRKSGGGLDSDEIANGLKTALTQGAEKSTGKLSAADGFFKDAAVKILLPPEVSKVQSKLKMLGLSGLMNNAVLSMNRAAEDAAKSATPIFITAIKQMSITDALSILKGSDTAATSYLRRSTLMNLTNAFMPIVQASLQKVDATKYWNDVFNTYNKFSFNKVDPDINSYVTTKALNGIFYYVAQEEKNIRTNPGARASDILKKVFGTK